jgi:hypothetical protein
MTRNQLRTEYAAIRRRYVAIQTRACTKYGKPATARTFDRECRQYMTDVCGIDDASASDWVDAARELLRHLDGGLRAA